MNFNFICIINILLFLVLGGSILDDYTVLTAGHCCDNGPAEDYRVRAGALRVTHNADGKVIFGLLFLVEYIYVLGIRAVKKDLEVIEPR